MRISDWSSDVCSSDLKASDDSVFTISDRRCGSNAGASAGGAARAGDSASVIESESSDAAKRVMAYPWSPPPPPPHTPAPPDPAPPPPPPPPHPPPPPPRPPPRPPPPPPPHPRQPR